MSDEVFVPVQKRSIDKKNRIKEAGYAVFCEKGYYNTNTKEIAERAGVSTGILYRYYPDKKSILLDIMDGYYELTLVALSEQLNTLTGEATDMPTVIERLVEYFIAAHSQSGELHEELASLAHYDDEVEAKYYRMQESMVDLIIAKLTEKGFSVESPHEKIHIILCLFEEYCHEVTYHFHSGENYERLRSLMVDTAVFLLTDGRMNSIK